MNGAENTDANSKVSAESANEFKALQGLSAQSVDPTDPVKEDQRLSYVRTLKTLMPKYAYMDNNYLLHKLRADEALQDSLVNTIVQKNVEIDNDFQQFWESDETDDEERRDFKRGLRKKIHRDISQHVYDGKTVKQSIVDRQLRLSKTSADFQLPNPSSIVKKNKDNYQKFFDKEEIQAGVDPELVQSLYENNDEFRAQLITDKVSMFEDQMEKSANQGFFDASQNPDEYAKAFSIYNRFGSEALTDYMNILQHYVPDADIQDNRVISAFRRFKKSPLYADNSPFKYAEKFIQGSEQEGIAPLTFQPRKQIEQRPKDWNEFTSATLYTEKNADVQTHQERTANFINEILKFEELEAAEFSLGGGEDTPLDELEKDKPLDLEKAFAYNKRRHEKEGKYFPDYGEATYNLVDRALHAGEDSKLSLEGIVSTLAANATNLRETDEGTYVYEMSYESLKEPENQHLKILADALLIHPVGDSMISRAGDTLRIEPDKQHRRNIMRANMTLNDFAGGLFRLSPIINRLAGDVELFSKEKELIVDEAGGVVGFEEKVPNSLRNTVAGLAVGFSDIIPEAYGGIVGGWGGSLARYFDEKTGVGGDLVEDLENLRHKQRDYYSGMLQEFTEPLIGEWSATEIGIGGGTFMGYMAGIRALGKGILKGGAKALGQGTMSISQLNKLSALRKTKNFKNFYKLARKSNANAAQSLRNTMRAVKNKYPYTVPAEFTVGAAGVETFTDPQFSWATFADLIIQEQAMGLKGEDKWNIDRTYRTTNSLGRWAIDFLGGEMIGVLVDGMIGVGKFANDYTLRSLRGKPKLGLEFDASTGRYKPEAESKYFTESKRKPLTAARKYLFPDTQRFVFNVRNNVDNIPLGDISKSAAKYARMVSPGAQYYEEGVQATQADIAAKFVADSNQFMSTVKEDLRSVIEEANQKYGGKAKLSDEQIDDQVNSIYNDFMDQTAKQIREFVGDGGEFNTRQFAQFLEDHPVRTEQVSAEEFRGKTDLNRTEATILHKQNPNSYVIESGDGTYRVYRQDPALWRYDLANRLRQTSESVDNFDQTVDTHIRRFGIDLGKEEDIDDAGRIIETLQSTYGVGLRKGDREGVIEGFTSDGWKVRWDDGEQVVYNRIRGMQDVDETPPDIRPRQEAETPEEVTTQATGRFDEQGVEIEEEIASSQKPQETPERVLDLRTPEQIMRDLDEQFRTRRLEELEQVFADPEEKVAERIERIKDLIREGRHDEAQDVISEISDIRGGPQRRAGEVYEMPGVVDLRALVDEHREAYQAYRARREPTELDQVLEFHKERLREALPGGNLDNAKQDIQMMRGMGMTTDEVEEFIGANFAGDTRLADTLLNYNRSLDFGEGTMDQLMRARVNSKILQQIRDEALQRLPDNIKEQMVRQADLLVNRMELDEPQRLIAEGNEEVTGFRSWNSANERFTESRADKESMTNKQYRVALAEDLGTGSVLDIAKLQKTRGGGSEKIPITKFDSSSVLGEDGSVKKIKNSKGLIVRLDNPEGGLPFYAIGRKNNISGFPSRFVADQNGKVSYNQEWAFINPNVTQRVDGRLRRFKAVELPNGELGYKEHPDGEWLLNVQNPERIDYYDYMGRTIRDVMGNEQVIEGTPTEKLLTPHKVLGRNVDAIETIEPNTGNKIYKIVSPEDQALRYGAPVTEAGDGRTPHVTFEKKKMALSPLEMLPKFSKTGKAYAHAWLAVPGLMFTGNVGMDEHGNLTPFGYAALAMGVLGMGGVMIRSMTGQFKIRKAYDALSSEHKVAFDRFRWDEKVHPDGTPEPGLLTDVESAMFNRLQDAGVPKDDFALMRKIVDEEVTRKVFKSLDTGEEIGSPEPEYRYWTSEVIPEIEGEQGRMVTSSYSDWSTGIKKQQIGEGIEIRPMGGRGLTSKEMDMHYLQLDERSQGLVLRTEPGHEFRDVGEEQRLISEHEGPGLPNIRDVKSVKSPVSWIRSQRTPDGKLLLDELQIDNSLQKGKFSTVGDVNRDLYTAVLDDFVERAIHESDGEFYLTRGHMQSARYGDDPDTYALRERAKNVIYPKATELKSEFEPLVIRDSETIEQARRIIDRFRNEADDHDTLQDVMDRVITEEGGYVSELGKAIRRFTPHIAKRYGTKPEQHVGNVIRNISDIEREGLGTIGNLNVESVKGGYKLSLADHYFIQPAAREFYEANELAQRTFPNFTDFLNFFERKTKFGGLLQFYDNTLPNIIRKRYGAEVTMAKGDPKSVYDSYDQAFHRIKVDKDGLDKARGKTGKRIDWEILPGSLAAIGLASTAYAMEGISDKEPETDPTKQKAGLGGVSMVLMGAVVLGSIFSRRFRTKIGGHIKGAVERSVKNSVDNVAEKTLIYDGKKFSSRELYELDISFNPNDPQSVGRGNMLLNGINRASRAGKKIGDWFTNSAYTQAGTQMLKNISERIKTATGTRNNTIADRIRELIVDANKAPSKIRRIAVSHFNDELGYGHGAFQSYAGTNGIKTVKNLFDSEMSDNRARVFFNGAVWRLMNRGIKKYNGRGIASADVPDNVAAMYRGENGRLFKQLDQDLMNNKEFVDYIDAYQKGYNEVRSRYLKLLGSEKDRRLLRFSKQPMESENYVIGDNVYNHQTLVNLVDRWMNGEKMLGYREFVKTLDPDERHLMRIASKKSDTFSDLQRLQKMRVRFTDLKGKYFPQVIDQDKVKAIRQRYVDFATKEGYDDPENWARQQMIKEFQNYNETGDARGLIGIDEDKLNVKIREFDSIHDAKVELMRIINKSAPREFQDQFDEYVGQRRVTPERLQELGFIVKDTNDVGEEVFYLRQPDDFNPTVGDSEFGLFDVANSRKFEEFYNTVMLDPAIRRSNFLENPRKFNLPHEWVVQDPEKVWKQYTTDTGYRLHALEYGLFDQRDFYTNYVNPMTTAMKNVGFDDEYISTAETRTKEIFDNQWGIINDIAGKSPREIEEYMKKVRSTNAGLQTFRNLNYMRYAYGFKYLDWFQTLLSTQVMTSGRAMRQAFGFGEDALPYQGLRNFEDLLIDSNVIKEKDLSFRFDQQALDPTGEHGSVSGWMQRVSQKGADKISDFSFEKSALRLLGIDVGSNGRAFRMVTDSFHGVNVMNTGQNAFAFMADASYFARIAKEMKDAGIGVDQSFKASDGQTYSWQRVYSRLEDLGVSRTKDLTVTDADGNVRTMKEADYFIEQENQLRTFINKMKNNERLSLNDFDAKYADIVENMWHFATESYHGTNKAMRPEKWNSQLGRTLSMYASFTYNLAMQTTKKRILDPMNHWIDRYATDSQGNQQIGKMQLALLLKHIRSGNEEALRNAGITDVKRAIAEFPIDAVNSARRAMAGVGFSIATYTTLDIMRDIYALPVNAALGEEQFQRTKESFSGVINPYDDEDKQVTLQEIFGGEADAQDMMKLMTWVAGKFAQSSYGGMYLSPFESMTKYGFRGTANLAPVVGIGDRFVGDVISLSKPVGTLNFDELPPEILKFGINNLPVISSNVFTESRESVRDKIKEYEQSLRND